MSAKNNDNFSSVFHLLLIGHKMALSDRICHIIINNQSEARKRMKKNNDCSIADAA